MSKKSAKQEAITNMGLMGASVALFLGGVTHAAVGMGYYHGASTGVRADLANIAEQVREKLYQGEEKDLSTPISELDLKYQPTSPDTSFYVSGSYNSGYCIAAYNETTNVTDDGMTYAENGGAKSLYDDFSCPTDATKMTLVHGHGDNKMADGSEYEAPALDTGGVFLFSFLGSMLFFALGANRHEKRLDQETEEILSELSKGRKRSKLPAVRKAVGSDLRTEIEIVENFPKTDSTASVKKNPLPGLKNRVEKVKSEWATYELDIVKILDYPNIANMGFPATSDFHKALRKAEVLIEQDANDVAALNDAVLDLEHKFTVMIAEAKRTKWSDFSEAERVSLRAAQNLLSIAINSASSANERQIAYKRLIKEVEGILVFPEKAILEIETKHRLSLEVLNAV